MLNMYLSDPRMMEVSAFGSFLKSVCVSDTWHLVPVAELHAQHVPLRPSHDGGQCVPSSPEVLPLSDTRHPT